MLKQICMKQPTTAPRLHLETPITAQTATAAAACHNYRTQHKVQYKKTHLAGQLALDKSATHV
jgi:hypothetical protein